MQVNITYSYAMTTPCCSEDFEWCTSHHRSVGKEKLNETNLWPPSSQQKGEIGSDGLWCGKKCQVGTVRTVDSSEAWEKKEGPGRDLRWVLTVFQTTESQLVTLRSNSDTWHWFSWRGTGESLVLTQKGSLVPEFLSRKYETFCVASQPMLKY